MVNLELYRVFYTVAKCGSLTKAAQELYISQPAVSQAIKQLEQQLGTSLFNRTHRGMELSASGGKMIFHEVEEALKLLDGAEDRLTELKKTATGTIRIGATDSIFSHILADKIAAFSQKYPAVRLELMSATSFDTVNQLKDGICDVGFINMPLDDSDIKLCGTVYHLSDIFIAGKKFTNLRGDNIPIEKLQEYPMLMIEPNTVARRELAAFTRTLGVQLLPDFEIAGWDLLVKLVKKGMGVGCVPREYVAPELASGEVFEIKISPALPARGVGLAIHKDAPVSYALKQFLAMFER